MITVAFSFSHHASHQTEVRSVGTIVGNPVAVMMAFPRHAAQQMEVRSIRVKVGSPVTTTVTFPHHAMRQMEVRSVGGHAGCPVTTAVAFPHHAARQTELRSVGIHIGNTVTTTAAFPYPATQQTELRSVRSSVGSPYTATVAFPHHVPLQTELHLRRAHAGRPVTAMMAFPPYFPQRVELHLRRTHSGSPVTVTISFPPYFPTQTAILKWENKWKALTTSSVNLQYDYRNYTTTSIKYRHDWRAIRTIALAYRYWSLTPSGWSIVAKNLETGESHALGFIDTDNPAVEDVFLPDGDYEISVLTSSLFWKDCLDRTVRTLSVRPGEEVTPLPTIYNLRSVVLDGVTTIRWSANQSDLGDCVFGVWYSSETPVDVARPADTTVWYSSLQTEYATTFYQNAPAYVAVAAMRTDDEPEIGKIHTHSLDWSNVPPRRPDDVIVLNAPLPVIDVGTEKRREDDPFWAMWNG